MPPVCSEGLLMLPKTREQSLGAPAQGRARLEGLPGCSQHGPSAANIRAASQQASEARMQGQSRALRVIWRAPGHLRARQGPCPVTGDRFSLLPPEPTEEASQQVLQRLETRTTHTTFHRHLWVVGFFFWRMTANEDENGEESPRMVSTACC